MQQPQGDDLTGPEVGFGVFGDGTQLLIDFIEQGGDKLHGDHMALLSWEGCHAPSVEESSNDCKLKNWICRNFHLIQFGVCSLPVTYRAKRGSATMTVSFKGAHFPNERTLMGVR